MKFVNQHHISFKNAFNGIRWAFASQPNFRVHIFLSLMAICGSIIFGITHLEMALLIVAIIFGFGAEMINTSIEAMTDLITTEYRQQAKIAKDVSAGMMLLIAFGTIILALFIFLPRIIAILV